MARTIQPKNPVGQGLWHDRPPHQNSRRSLRRRFAMPSRNTRRLGADHLTPSRMTEEAIEPITAISPSTIANPSPPPDDAATGMAVAETAFAGAAVAGLTDVAPTAGRAAGTPDPAGFGATELEAGTRDVSFFGGPEGIAGRGPAALAATGAPPGPGRGGRLMRTVSFLGALAGAAIGLMAPGGGATGAGPGSFGPAGGLTTAPGCGTELGGTEEPLAEIGWVGGKLDISAMRETLNPSPSLSTPEIGRARPVTKIHLLIRWRFDAR